MSADRTREPARRGPVGRVLGLARFGGWYVRQFLRANVQVLAEVLTPGIGITPVVVHVDLRSRTDVELASLIALVGLTPGTLVVGSQDDRSGGGGARLSVHALSAPDREDAVEQIEELERRMLAAWRGTRPGAERGTRPPAERGTRPPAERGTRPPAERGTRPPAERGGRA